MRGWCSHRAQDPNPVCAPPLVTSDVADRRDPTALLPTDRLPGSRLRGQLLDEHAAWDRKHPRSHIGEIKKIIVRIDGDEEDTGGETLQGLY